VDRFLLLTVAVLLYGSFEPWIFDFSKPGSSLLSLLTTWPRLDLYALRDAAVNLAMYFPLGALAWMAAARRYSRTRAAVAAVAAAMALSTAAEWLQYYDRGRVGSAFDVTTNVLGSAAGAAAAMLFLSRFPGWQPARLNRREAAAAALLLAGWVTYQAFPTYPMFHYAMLRAAWAQIAHPPSIAAVEVLANAAEWLAAAVVLEAITGRMHIGWLLAAIAYLPLRLIMPNRGLRTEELLGAALAALLCVVGSRAGFRPRVFAAAGLLLAALALGELTPFHFSRSAQAVAWTPFRAAFTDGWPSVFPLWRKAYDYGAAACLLRLSGLSFRSAGFCLAAGLALCATVQVWMPARIPDASDATLALVAGLGLAWLTGTPPGLRSHGGADVLQQAE